jgi:hypothetical protein
MAPDSVVQKYWPRLKGLRFKYKIERMIECAGVLARISAQYGSFMKYLQIRQLPERIQDEAGLRTFWEQFVRIRSDLKAHKIPYFSNFTSLCHLLMDLGYDCAKPDSAVVHAAAGLGIVPTGSAASSLSDRDRQKVIEVMQTYALAHEWRVAVVDLYLLTGGGQSGTRNLVRPRPQARPSAT